MLTEDTARDPMALVRAQARPSLPGVVRPTVEGMTPDDPGFRRKVQPPDPMSPVEVAAIEEERRRREASVTPGVVPGVAATPGSPVGPAPSAYRLLVTSCREEDMLIVGLERAPDWDVSETWAMSVDAANQVARVLRAVGIRIKDMSGGYLEHARVPADPGPTVPDADSRGPRVEPGDMPDLRGPGADHAGEPVGRTDPGGETGIRRVDPEQTVEFLQEARRRFDEEVAARAREAESHRGEDPSPAPDDREDALRRRLGLPTRADGPTGLRVGDGDLVGPPGGPGRLADGETEAQPE